jgi:replicative DNA helicase
MERLLPQNIEAEQGVLGSILIDPEAIYQVADTLHAEDFYRDAHRVIYQGILALHVRRVPADFSLLCDELERTNHLEQVGGMGYISSLVNVVPTSGNVEHYAAIVARTAVLRRLVHGAGQIAAWAYSQDSDALEKAEKMLYQLQRQSTPGDWTSMPVLMSAYMEELEDLYRHRGTLSGVSTGFSDIDATLNGLQKSDLILLAGRPSIGKTSLGLCIGYNAALRGKKVAVFSLEMGRMSLARRLMSMASKVDMQRLRSGWIHDEEWDGIVRKAGDLSQLSISVNDTAGSPVASMRSQLRRLTGGVDLVVIDYLGLIEPDADSGTRSNLVQQISAISRGLKGLAREFDVPVLTLCQLSRAVESRPNKRPMLSDLRDSGSLEQDADVVMFIYRDDYYRKREDPENFVPDHMAEVIIAKHRNGPTGDVKLYFQEDRTMFYNLDGREVAA